MGNLLRSTLYVLVESNEHSRGKAHSRLRGGLGGSRAGSAGGVGGAGGADGVAAGAGIGASVSKPPAVRAPAPAAPPDDQDDDDDQQEPPPGASPGRVVVGGGRVEVAVVRSGGGCVARCVGGHRMLLAAGKPLPQMAIRAYIRGFVNGQSNACQSFD